nr:EOG090X04Z9 [Triops cancriformis]
MKAATAVGNMALAHEIAVLFSVLCLVSIEKRVTDLMHKAFWDCMEEELKSDPPTYERTLSCIEEFRETMLNLILSHQTKTAQEIKEKLDTELIKQQADAGVLDLHSYLQYMISLMGRMCAPFRDEKIQELTQIRDIVPLFRGIMEMAGLMRIDFANFAISQVKPHIVAHGVQYEREKFEQYLKVTPDGLRNTKAWLARHVAPDKSNAKVLADAYLELLEWNSENLYPETVAVDELRFKDLQKKCFNLQMLGSVLLVAFSTAAASLQSITEFRTQFKQHIEVVLGELHSNEAFEPLVPNIVLQIIKEVEAALPRYGQTEMSSTAKEVLEIQLKQLSNPDNSIRQLVRSRIRGFLETIISSDTMQPTPIPPGLSLLKEDLTRLAGQFARLVSYNRSVYTTFYNDIISQLTGSN